MSQDVPGVFGTLHESERHFSVSQGLFRGISEEPRKISGRCLRGASGGPNGDSGVSGGFREVKGSKDFMKSQGCSRGSQGRSMGSQERFKCVSGSILST